MLWVLFATFFNAGVGNLRSITSPKKVDPNKVQPAAGLTAERVNESGADVGGGCRVGAGLILLGRSLGLLWLPIPVLLVGAVGAVLFYLRGLKRIDGLVAEHRETLIEELCKAS